MGKKSSSPPPAPDPAIGQAAAQNVELGRQWLDFSKEQYKDSEGRQQDTDALVKRVVESGLATQQQADAWAQEDRKVQADYRQKYDGWANQDRQLGRDTMASLDKYGADASAAGQRYEAEFMRQAAEHNAFGGEERDRYKTLFRPVQDKVVSDAMSWDSDARLDSEAAKAKADVVGNAAQQQQVQQRQMASMGIDPRSGRYAAIDRSAGLTTALAAAGAQNATRDNVRGQAQQMRGQATQLGQQVLGNGTQASQLGMQATGAAHTARQAGDATAMQAKNMGLAAAGIGNTAASLGIGNQGGGYTGLGLGITAGNAAVGANGAGNNSFIANTGIMNTGYGGAIQGNTAGGNLLNNLYGNQLNAWGIQQQASGQASAGFGSMLGTLGGAAIAAW
ncbi:MAG: hypothetical protein K0S54_1143 [Alphaproteobacteria bacterium]|jgi:hypothetical protein|nr:hypothetical protein [Alphaproteobacteria bacterium]